ncbi:hypothetical protein BH10BAC2_BH10BAC2_04350 [soil metagenome]
MGFCYFYTALKPINMSKKDLTVSKFLILMGILFAVMAAIVILSVSLLD